MPLYLTKFSYTPETWARLISKPEDRRKAAQAYIDAVGGKLHGFWYAFGTHDGYTLWEAPDNVSMAAVALAITAGGALAPSKQRLCLLSMKRSTRCVGLAKSATNHLARRSALPRVARALAGQGNNRPPCHDSRLL